MAMQYSPSVWRCRLLMNTVLALCIPVLLNASASSASRLLVNRSTTLREQVESSYHDKNGLGRTPPMG